jgi:hypothetical protein
MGFDKHEEKVEAAMRNGRGQRPLKLGTPHVAGIETSAAVLMNRMLISRYFRRLEEIQT